MLATAPLPLTDADVFMYGKIAKNILASGDWLTLGHPALLVDVPPLTIWLMAVSLRLGGDTAVALRLWHLLMALALVVVTYRLARLGGGREESLLAALLLLTTQQIFTWSLAPKQDIPLTLFLALAVYDYLLYRRDGRWAAAVRAGIWVGLAVLTKGLAGLAAFGLIAGADLLLAWRLSAPGHWRWTHVAAGAAAFLVVAAPWYVHGILRQGDAFVQLYFLQRSTAWRFFQAYGTPLPYWAGLVIYVPLLLAGVLPWTGLVPGAIREGWRSLRDRTHVLRLCAVWVGIVLVVLSLSTGTKSIRYLLPVYPPLAILSAHFLNKVMEMPRGLRTPAAMLLLIWVPALLAAMVFGRDSAESTLYLPTAAVFTLAVAGFVVAALRGRGRPAVALLAAGALVTYGVFAWTTTLNFERMWPWRIVSEEITRRHHPGDRVLIVGQSHWESNFVNYYLDGPAMFPVDEATLRRTWTGTRLLAVLAPEVHRHLETDLRPRTLIAMPSGWVLVTNR